MIDGCTLSECRLEIFQGGGVEVNCGYSRLSHTKPKAYGSVHHLTLEGKEEAAELESGEIGGS